MNLLNRVMSYDKTKVNRESCNCEKCISTENAELKNQTVEYPKLSEEEIEQIINERYFNKDEKTKTFIKKALRKHGDRYDYSNTFYVKAHEKVEIICRIEGHLSFWQTPTNHLQGKGCFICGGKQKLTIEEFIKRATKIHGIGRYDYSKISEYVNNRSKVEIICLKEGHGSFYQQISHHLSGEGCPICSGRQKSTLEEFIEKSNKKFGVGTYDYSKVIYINNHTKVEIICPKEGHGSFWQTPYSHLKYNGCPRCGFEEGKVILRLTLEEFIERARKIHGDKYDYSKVNYINAITKVCIICKNHKNGDYEFWQTPHKHLSSHGCPRCNETLGETKVRMFLSNNNIKFEQEKRFKECRDKNPLPFDFYLPQYNLCIEFDGEGHFEKINWDGNYTNEQLEEKLKSYKYHDQIKNDYCKNNGINLLRIRYDENVEEKLTEYFQEHEIM